MDDSRALFYRVATVCLVLIAVAVVAYVGHDLWLKRQVVNAFGQIGQPTAQDKAAIALAKKLRVVSVQFGPWQKSFMGAGYCSEVTGTVENPTDKFVHSVTLKVNLYQRGTLAVEDDLYISAIAPHSRAAIDGMVEIPEGITHDKTTVSITSASEGPVKSMF